jgi:hypothetical protein
MVIKSNKKNPLINKLFSKKYKPRIVKSKKERVVLNVKKVLKNSII